MQATPPYIDVPGDPTTDSEWLRSRIMARSGALIGFGAERCVWRFGFLPGSEAANAYGVALEGHGFLWVLATRKTGKVVDTFRGWALELPDTYRKVIDNG